MIKMKLVYTGKSPVNKCSFFTREPLCLFHLTMSRAKETRLRSTARHYDIAYLMIVTCIIDLEVACSNILCGTQNKPERNKFHNQLNKVKKDIKKADQLIPINKMTIKLLWVFKFSKRFGP